jgi:hypothetical protein
MIETRCVEDGRVFTDSPLKSFSFISFGVPVFVQTPPQTPLPSSRLTRPSSQPLSDIECSLRPPSQATTQTASSDTVLHIVRRRPSTGRRSRMHSAQCPQQYHRPSSALPTASNFTPTKPTPVSGYPTSPDVSPSTRSSFLHPATPPATSITFIAHPSNSRSIGQGNTEA